MGLATQVRMRIRALCRLRPQERPDCCVAANCRGGPRPEIASTASSGAVCAGLVNATPSATLTPAGSPALLWVTSIPGSEDYDYVPPLSSRRGRVAYPDRSRRRRHSQIGASRVRFAPKADKSLHRSEMTSWATLRPEHAQQCSDKTAGYSITSSARASSIGGTSRPNALAVLRLITNSNFVARSTGRSVGLIPLRRRPVCSPARR